MVSTIDLVAHCGLYCGDCFIHQGKIADLARDLRAELRRAKFERNAAELAKIPFFKELSGYGDCYRVLGAMVRFRCRNACRKGGGPPFCKIRKCCQKKGIDGCWQCTEFESCRNSASLEPVHGDAHLKNLRVLKKSGVEKFVTGKRYW